MSEIDKAKRIIKAIRRKIKYKIDITIIAIVTERHIQYINNEVKKIVQIKWEVRKLQNSLEIAKPTQPQSKPKKLKI